MWPPNRILDLLGIEHPILQSPMAGATTPQLAAAVSNAGGLGGFGAAGTSAPALRDVIREIKSLTDRPFQLNLFAPTWKHYQGDEDRERALRAGFAPAHSAAGLGEPPDPIELFTGFEEKLEVVLEERVPVLSLHFGTVEGAHVEALKEREIKVIGTGTSAAEAQALEAAGFDAVIAQGLEAGGHQGTFEHQKTRLGTLALVPAVVDAVSIPVIAAGGIADARGLVAALALGAGAVQLGTAFLPTVENVIHPTYRRALLESEGSDTVITSAISGKPARAIRNKLVDLTESQQEHALPYPWQYSTTRDLRKESAAGDGEYLAMWAGQGVGLVNEQSLCSAADLVDQLVTDSRELLAGLTQSQ